MSGDANAPLTTASFQKGLKVLLSRDADLAGVVDRWGPPPFRRRKPGFASLVLIILEQQVSLASARAVYERLVPLVRPFSASRFRRIDPATLQHVGLTRQKRAYCHHLAEAIAQKRLCLKGLADLPDAQARKALMQVKGIGCWTADIYLLTALRRPDVWPRGDLALKTAAAAVKRLNGVPSDTVFASLGDAWRPWRAVAARLLWHDYLSSRQRPS